MYYVYVLHSALLNRFYIGSAANVENRLRRHLSNHRGYTSKAKDWEIVYIESFEKKADALNREKVLKGWKNPDRILSLIQRSSS